MAALNEFHARYASMSDDELERLWRDVSSLVPNAKEALQGEMERRQLPTEIGPIKMPGPEKSQCISAVNLKQLAMDRYENGYLIANGLARLGTVAKVFAISLGCIIVIDGFVSEHGGTPAAFTYLFFGVLAAVVGYCVGVLVQAAGELLKALFDTAVSGSHFLDDDDRARVMFSLQ